MFAALPYIAGGLATAITFFVKHPIITKMLIFSAFLGIIGYSVTYIKTWCLLISLQTPQ